jgi:ubiquinone/menaquinone biosynthesis C-methylase UbiE
MNSGFIFLVLFGLIIILILTFGLPRKKSKRIASIEGIDSPDVAKAFEKMTNILPFKLLRRRIITELKNYDLKGRLVDIGCGSGNLIVQIAKNFEDVDLLGHDIPNEVLEFAKKRATIHKVNGRVKFGTGNVENIPLLDNSVDFIISTLSLHHWNDPIKALKELIRILKKDGLLIIFDFRRDSRKFFYGLITFATKIVAPKALKEINEPLSSINASYTVKEVREMLSQIEDLNIKPYLAWMFIVIKKT